MIFQVVALSLALSLSLLHNCSSYAEERRPQVQNCWPHRDSSGGRTSVEKPIHVCLCFFPCLTYGACQPLPHSQPLLLTLPKWAHYFSTSGSFQYGSQTNLVNDTVGSCHLKVSSQPSDKKPEKIIQGRGLSRAGGRMELSCLGPEAWWFLMESLNKQERGDIRILTRPRGLGQT